MKIGLDIDETISTNPEFYSELSRDTYKDGGSIVIISSRSENQEVRDITMAELLKWGIGYDKLYLFKPLENIEHLCPYDLKPHQKYLWQKAYYCIDENVDCYYDDDDNVIELFKAYVPNIIVKDSKLITKQ